MADKWKDRREEEPDGDWLPWPGSEYDWTFPFKWLLFFCVVPTVLIGCAYLIYYLANGLR